MKVKKLIEELQKLDPEMGVVTIIGDCDNVYEAGVPDFVFVDDPDDPMSWGNEPNKFHMIKAVRV